MSKLSKLTIAFFAILLHWLPLFAQPGKLALTHKNRAMADAYKDNKRCDSAIIFYNKVIKDETHSDVTDFVKLAYCNLVTKDTAGFLKNIQTGILRGADSSYIISSFRNVSPQDSSFIRSYLKTDFGISRLKFIAGTDTALIRYMDKIMELDQLVRSAYKFDTNLIYIKQIGRFADSVNFLRIKKIIEDGQYPGLHRYGLQASKYTIALYHIADDDETKVEYIFDFMKKQLLKGEMTVGEVRTFATRHYGNTGGKYGNPCNYYGTKYAHQKRWSDLPLCDCDKIDDMRKEIGLETLKEYYQKEKFALPECYKTK